MTSERSRSMEALEHSWQVLQKLWETGEWSDLKVATATRVFYVHKNIVCTACPFFAAACTRDWQESRTGIISLPEDEVVIEAMLKTMYAFDGTESVNDLAKHSKPELIKVHMRLYVAADKYGFMSLRDYSEETILADIEELRNNEALDLALWFYEIEQRNLSSPGILREVVASAARALTQSLLENGTGLIKLGQNPDLLKDVLYLISKRANQVDALANIEAEDHQAEYLQDKEELD